MYTSCTIVKHYVCVRNVGALVYVLHMCAGVNHPLGYCLSQLIRELGEVPKIKKNYCKRLQNGYTFTLITIQISIAVCGINNVNSQETP